MNLCFFLGSIIIIIQAARNIHNEWMEKFFEKHSRISQRDSTLSKSLRIIIRILSSERISISNNSRNFKCKLSSLINISGVIWCDCKKANKQTNSKWFDLIWLIDWLKIDDDWSIKENQREKRKKITSSIIYSLSPMFVCLFEWWW